MNLKAAANVHCTLLTLALFMLPAQIVAQTHGLRIMRIAPTDSGTSGSLISITFDRPVVGLEGRSLDDDNQNARRVMSVTPDIPGVYEWRDPVTIRFVPDKPFTPGTNFVVSLDTAAIASRGSRDGKLYEFPIRVPGARPLVMFAGSSIAGPSAVPEQLGPLPLFRVAYSAAVNLDSVAAGSKLVFPEKCGGTIALEPLAQRAIRRGDGYQLENAGGYDRDTTADRFRRVVELQPVDSLMPGCDGIWHVVPFDTTRPMDSWRYRISTAPPFQANVKPCTARRSAEDSGCEPDGLTISFSSAIGRDDILSKIHVPEMIPAKGEVPISSAGAVQFAARLMPRHQYAVSIDTSVRDIFGRKLTGPNTFVVTAHDHSPGILSQTGLVTLPFVKRHSATITVRTINVDTLEMYVVPIPDSLTAQALWTPTYLRPDMLRSITSALRDTVRVRVATHAKFNIETTVNVPVPAAVITHIGSQLSAVRFAIARRMLPADSPSLLPSAVVTAGVQRVAVGELRVLDKLTITGVRSTAFTGPYTELFVQFSALRAHAKFASEAGAVLITSASGAPLADANVHLMTADGLLSSARSNRQGLALLPQDPPSSAGALQLRGSSDIQRDPGRASLRYLEVTHGSDKLLLPVNAGLQPSTELPVDACSLGSRCDRASLVHSAVTSDRDIYRPGEVVFVKTYVRYGISGATTTPVGDSVRVSLVSADTLDVKLGVLNSFGTQNDSLRIPSGAHLGTYLLAAQVRVAGRWVDAASSWIRVAEFRAPEFVVEVSGDSISRTDSPHFIGDTIAFRVDAKYLYGRPMAGARVQWSAMVTPVLYATTIPGTAGYTIGQTDWREPRAQPNSLVRGETDSLNNDGHVVIAVPTRALTVTRPSMIGVSVAVTDVNNQVVTSSISAPIEVASVYVAARANDDRGYWNTGARHTVDVLVVHRDGRPIAGIPVHASLLRYHESTDSTNGFVRGAPHWVTDTIRQLAIKSATTPVPFSFEAATDGVYDIRIEAKDELGRTAATNIIRRAYAHAFPGSQRANSYLLRVATQHADSVPFAIGDTARVMFDSPFADADAWITLEREGVLQQHVQRVHKGMTTVRVPIERRFAPNIFVGVTLINRNNGLPVKTDSSEHLFRSGYAEIRLDSTAHQLHVHVASALSQWAPGDSARVQVQVTDATASNSGTRSEIALWAVDEGALSLTGYKTPDILRILDAQHGVSSKPVTSFGMLPWLHPTGEVLPGVNRLHRWPTEEKRLTFSVAEVPASGRPSAAQEGFATRSNLRITAFFVGAATTDSHGFVEIQAKLPDNITTFRLMATAIASNNRYGSGEASLLATRRVVIRPALPRFVRSGDSVVLAAIVSIQQSAVTSLGIDASASGVNMRGAWQLMLSANDTKSAIAQFAAVVPEKSAADVTRVKFAAHDTVSGDNDAIETALPIHPDGTPRAHTVVGVFRDSGIVTLQLPAGIDPARSTVTMQIGASPIVAMRTQYERLRAYPYYSTDAIVTTARALLALSRIEGILGERVTTHDTGAYQHDLQLAVDELTRREIGDGYFRMFATGQWRGGLGLTTEIGDFLRQAKRDGATVPASTVRNIHEAVKLGLHVALDVADTTLGSPAERRSHLRSYLGARINLARYMRDEGTSDVAMEDSLLSKQGLLTWEDRVLLAELLSERPTLRTTADEMLVKAWTAVSAVGNRIEIPDSLRGYREFPSHIRPAARLLHATMKLQPAHPLLGALVETITRQGQAERAWVWNTQDYGSAVQALATFAESQRAVNKTDVTVRSQNGALIVSNQSLEGLLQPTGEGGMQLTLSLNRRAEAIRERADENAPAYYSITVNDVPKNRPITPDEAGMVVERWYENFDTGKPINEAREGDLVRVQLRVTVTADRELVAIEDLLPAGLEAVDLSLRTTATLGPFAKNNVVPQQSQSRQPSAGPAWQGALYGSWEGGWWTPWEYKEMRDDRVMYFARQLWPGTYSATYVARATTSGVFVKPPAHAEEMYNAAVQGRSDGGTFTVRR